MAKLVILKFNGNLQSGCQVSLEIGEEKEYAARGLAGNLPPALQLSQALTKWQQQYAELSHHSRIKPQQIIYDGSIDPQRKLVRLAQSLQYEFQQWLDSSSFYAVNKHLREELDRTESIRLLVCSDRYEIYQLPWCSWDLAENYSNLEIALSNFDFQKVSIQPKLHHHSKVRILAILGDGEGIDLDADRNFLSSLEGGNVTFLKEPSRQKLYSYLWEQPWDIVFFAGHSQTIARQGILYLNQEDKLTIEQLKYGFAQAIANGLQLAIFNSCDGIGIAEELAKLALPQSIVMRMPIPDVIAQKFIKHFLQAYAGGNSLYLATKIARQRLQAEEKDSPYASWLPIIYQNPAAIPPSWIELGGKRQLPYLSKLSSFQPQNLVWQLLASAIALILVCLIQSWGWLETSELKTYDRFITYRLTPAVDQRVLVITIDDDDIRYQKKQKMDANMRGSLSDQALHQLLNKLQSGGAKVIASDVIHDFPFEPELEHNIAQSDNFFAICRIKINNPKLIAINPPPSLPIEQIGFSNLAIDDDGAIRRQIVGMSPDQVCSSSSSLSLRLALKYLDDIPTEYEAQGTLKIGSTKFPRLQATSGGYHLPEAQGYQILLNYHHALPATIPLQQALTIDDQSLAQLVKDKIVFIGVMGYNQDLHYTPYSQGKQNKRLAGVMIHAQMTSHIISSVLGEQHVIWWFCDRLEILWIAIWCVIGSAIVAANQNSKFKLFWSISLSLAMVFGIAWLLFLQGGWLIVIAPALGLLFSAAIFAIYSRSFLSQ